MKHRFSSKGGNVCPTEYFCDFPATSTRGKTSFSGVQLIYGLPLAEPESGAYQFDSGKQLCAG